MQVLRSRRVVTPEGIRPAAIWIRDGKINGNAHRIFASRGGHAVPDAIADQAVAWLAGRLK